MTPDPMTLDDLIDAQEARDDGRLARWGFHPETSKTEDSAPRQERGQDDEDHDNGGAS